MFAGLALYNIATISNLTSESFVRDNGERKMRVMTENPMGRQRSGWRYKLYRAGRGIQRNWGLYLLLLPAVVLLFCFNYLPMYGVQIAFRDSSLEALEVSYENGVNTFDTAEIYGDGRSERVVGEAARRIGREKVRIISKVFKPSMSHDKMIKACEDSLQRLGTDYLDVYFLHYPVAEEEVTIQERMETMEELKKAGKIRAIGLSNFSLEEMKAAMRFGQVDVIQPCYSLLWRYDEALLEFSRKQEISVIPYSTLAQGLLTGKYQKGAVFTDGRARAALFQPENYDRCLEVTDVLSQISAKYGKTPAQGAIAWLLQTPGITAPIVGAKNGRQAQENLKAAGWQFSKEDYDVIDRASRRFMEGLPHYTLFFNTETTN